MNVKQCSHIRIRDSNCYDLNIKEYTESLERQFNIDIRSLPQWKELIKRLHVMTTDCKRKIQDAHLRKTLIVQKLFTQFRPSPFELSENMARTAKKWEALKMKQDVNRIIDLETESTVTSKDEETMLEALEVESTFEDVKEAAHPNSEIVDSQHKMLLQENEVYEQTKPVQTDISYIYLPPKLYTNEHKLLSPLGSQFTGLNCVDDTNKCIEITEQEQRERMSLRHTSSVVSTPREIILKFDNLREQTIKFSITNCSADFMHIRFKQVTDTSHFKSVKILPVTPLRLYPGIAVVYKLVFKLVERKKEFTSELFFTVGRDVYDNVPLEAFRIPIASKFIKARNVSVSAEVTIPPLYVWHMKNDPEGQYPTGTVDISVNDDRYYHLHIVKKVVNFLKDTLLEDEKKKVDVESNISTFKVDFEQENQIDDPIKDSKAESKINTIKNQRRISSKSSNILESKKSKKLFESSKKDLIVDLRTPSFIELQAAMALVAQDIVEHSLETFIFDNTYLFLKPDTKKKLTVHFTKIERIGCHNCYYDFELYDPETDDLVLTKTTRIFAEILPHPIQINPDIMLLDMSNSHVIYGFCEDQFVITNTHRLYPVTIKIRLSKTMSKLFRIIPMETLVPTTTSVPFEIKFCSRDRKSKAEDLVHFTFKIIVIGPKCIYDKVTPFFFEVIAPCVNELKKINNTKYYYYYEQLKELPKVKMAKRYLL